MLSCLCSGWSFPHGLEITHLDRRLTPHRLLYAALRIALSMMINSTACRLNVLVNDCTQQVGNSVEGAAFRMEQSKMMARQTLLMTLHPTPS